MALNRGQKNALTNYFNLHRVRLLGSFRTGVRGDDAKENNYIDLQQILLDCYCNNTEAEVTEAAGIFEEVTKYELQIKKPPNDNGAARKLAALIADSSNVGAVLHGVDVRLDVGQLKHQHPNHPIGTRIKGGGNRFNATCDIAWHRATTIAHMAGWANGLGAMVEGQQTFHGQANAVNGIHYEGFCLMSGGRKYVSFHCYPADGSALKWG